MTEKYKVVKCKLFEFTRKNNDTTQLLNNTVMNVSKIGFYIYKFAGLHIIRLLESNLPIPTLNQQFFYTCMMYVTRIKKNQPKAISNV